MYSIIIPILHLTKLKHIGVLGTAGGIIFLLGNLTLCSRALKTFIYFDSVIALLWKQRKVYRKIYVQEYPGSFIQKAKQKNKKKPIWFFFPFLKRNMLRTFTFSLKVSTSQLLFGIFKSPASLLMCFGAIIK